MGQEAPLAAKLALQPGQQVLDIGSGWGGLGLFLADYFGVDGHRRDAFERAARVSNERARAAGLAEPRPLRTAGLPHARRPFDRIVSVGMFEHVGVARYREFFGHAHRLLKPDGVMLLHSIGRSGAPGRRPIPGSPKYIFPGGYIPALSEVRAGDRAKRPGRHRPRDPAPPLRRDAEGLARAVPRSWDEAVAIFDERFCRMWEFYLAGSEAAFRTGDMMVFQIQLVEGPATALPLTRDYMFDSGRRRCAPSRASANRCASPAPEDSKGAAESRLGTARITGPIAASWSAMQRWHDATARRYAASRPARMTDVPSHHILAPATTSRCTGRSRTTSRSNRRCSARC